MRESGSVWDPFLRAAYMPRRLLRPGTMHPMETTRVALCQVPARGLEDASLALEDILAALDQAGEAGAQLVALPECSYPAYYVGGRDPYAFPGVRPFDEVTAMLAGRARRYGYWLAAGLARPRAGGRLSNSGVVFGPDGVVRGAYDKSFLWHFDRRWFDPGSAFPVWDAGFARFGVLICADGRQPEIARSLAVNGAEIILDLTAWVSWGARMQDLSTTQCEYLMPVRAFENGVWVAAADKFGSEADTIVYAGRSCVIDPAGAVRVCAPSDRDAVVVYDMEPVEARPVPRRPSLYGTLTAPTASLPVVAALDEPLIPSHESRRVAVVPSGGTWDPVAASDMFRRLRAQDADLVVFGGAPAESGWEAGLAPLEQLVRAAGGVAVAGISEGGEQAVVVLSAAQTIVHKSSHGYGSPAGETLPPVLHTPAGRIGVLCGEEGFVPEVARILMLNGADIVAWPSFAAHPMLQAVARTRSDEDGVYTACAWPGGALVIAPGGAPITVSPEGSGIAMAAQVNTAHARWKDRAPGTNVVADRQPEAYRGLVG